MVSYMFESGTDHRKGKSIWQLELFSHFGRLLFDLFQRDDAK